MEITGFAYLAFFTVVLWLHRMLEGNHLRQKGLLIAASYYFYATIDWRFCALLIALTAINHAAGAVVASAKDGPTKKRAIAVAVAASLLLLAYFKYLNFFGSIVNSLSQALGGGSLVPFVDVLLPVGISFMTFQALTYPIDLYYGRLSRHCSFADFTLFIAFFPRLLSGPIVPAAYFLPQLQTVAPLVRESQRFFGLTLVMRGLVKKVMIADTLGAHLVNPAFATPEQFASPFLWLAMFAYSFQVYYDLSGYTDMALGAAEMIGYRLPRNFNRPYLATSVANFWQRWHITMSSFFRNYLYEPLAQRWPRHVYRNLLLVFVAIGLWHGAGWNFVVYGLVHGSLVAFEHRRSARRLAQGGAMEVLRGAALARRVALIFCLVSLTRILFRSSDLAAAGRYAAAMFHSWSGYAPLSTAGVLMLVVSVALHFTPVQWRERFMTWANTRPDWTYGIAFTASMFLVMAMARGRGGFIYFQF